MLRADIEMVPPEDLGTPFGTARAFRIDLGPGNGIGVLFVVESDPNNMLTEVQRKTLGQTLGNIAAPAQAVMVEVPPGTQFKVARVVARASSGKRRRRVN